MKMRNDSENQIIEECVIKYSNSDNVRDKRLRKYGKLGGFDDYNVKKSVLSELFNLLDNSAESGFLVIISQHPLRVLR